MSDFAEGVKQGRADGEEQIKELQKSLEKEREISAEVAASNHRTVVKKIRRVKDLEKAMLTIARYTAAGPYYEDRFDFVHAYAAEMHGHKKVEKPTKIVDVFVKRAKFTEDGPERIMTTDCPTKYFEEKGTLIIHSEPKKEEDKDVAEPKTD